MTGKSARALEEDMNIFIQLNRCAWLNTATKPARKNGAPILGRAVVKLYANESRKAGGVSLMLDTSQQI